MCIGVISLIIHVTGCVGVISLTINVTGCMEVISLTIHVTGCMGVNSLTIHVTGCMKEHPEMGGSGCVAVRQDFQRLSDFQMPGHYFGTAVTV